MTFGSLFAGIGGFDLGFTRAGLVCTWQVEIDPFCRRVLEKHWPNATRYEDVRRVHARATCDGCDDCLDRVDVVCGGFPCQDISRAGLRDGIDGDQSGLWSEFERLIRELRPDFVVVENVPTLTLRGLGRVLGGLAACGLDAEWDCLPASLFGAPHRRDRIWIVGHVPDADRTRLGQQWRAFPVRAEFATVERRRGWPAESGIRRVDHGVPDRVDRLRGLGNAIVPQIAEWIGEQLTRARAEVRA